MMNDRCRQRIIQNDINIKFIADGYLFIKNFILFGDIVSGKNLFAFKRI
jgi:hypothetical protein